MYFFNRTLEALMVVQDKDPKMQPPPYDQMGVFHGSELGWVFDVKIALDFRQNDSGKKNNNANNNNNNNNNESACTEQDMAQLVGAYWTNFGSFHDPSPPNNEAAGAPLRALPDFCGSPNWPKFTTSTTTSAADNKDRVGDGGDDEHYLYFGLTSAENRADALKEANCDFWDANPVPVGAVFGSPDEIN